MTNATITDLAATRRRQLREAARAVLCQAEHMRAEAALLKAGALGRADRARVVELERARG